jgi:sugar O-acyltransferase (sialic acid O-acetyltransferase NeuD family)
MLTPSASRHSRPQEAKVARVVVFGTGLWAELAHFYLTHDSPHEVVGFTVDRDYLVADRFKDLPVVPFEDVHTRFPPGAFQMFIPIGFRDMNQARARKYGEAKRRGYELTSYVSSKATVWPGFTCGDNCFIFEHNNIQPFVTIGNDVVMWSANHIGHHSVIKDHVTITSHVVVAGCCTIDDYCFLGANCTIRDETVVARATLVGMGVTIQADTREHEVYKAQKTAPAAIRSDELFTISHKSNS